MNKNDLGEAMRIIAQSFNNQAAMLVLLWRIDRGFANTVFDRLQQSNSIGNTVKHPRADGINVPSSTGLICKNKCQDGSILERGNCWSVAPDMFD